MEKDIMNKAIKILITLIIVGGGISGNYASAAKKITATANGMLNYVAAADGKINPRGSRVNYNLDINLEEPASAGDFVEYCLENLPGFPSRKVYVDGVEVGDVVRMEESNERRRTIQNSHNQSYEVRKNLKPGGDSACYKVIFNEKIVEKGNEAISISVQGNTLLVAAKEDYSMNSRIVFNGLEIASKQFTVAKYPISEFTKSSAFISGVGSKYTDAGNIDIIGLTLSFRSSSNNPIKAGEIVNYEIKNLNYKFSKRLSAGDVGEFTFDGITPTSADEYNADNVYVYDFSNKVRYEVIEISDNILRLKLLDDTRGGYQYTIIPGVDLVNLDAIDFDKKVLKDFTVESSIGTVDDYRAKYSNTQKYDMSISTVRTLSKNGVSLPKSSIIVKYVDEEGNEVAKSKTLVDNKVYKTPYEDSGAIEIEGYDFVKIHDKSAPISGSVDTLPQTIVYVYRKNPTLIKAEEKPEIMENNKGSGQVVAPNTGFMNASSSALGLVGIMIVLTCLVIKRK